MSLDARASWKDTLLPRVGGGIDTRGHTGASAGTVRNRTESRKHVWEEEWTGDEGRPASLRVREWGSPETNLRGRVFSEEPNRVRSSVEGKGRAVRGRW